jgi:hypothetical protein
MIVRESIEDMLKPKDTDDIKKELRGIIFWKGVTEGKLSPVSIKYFLDKDFLKKRAKELGLLDSGRQIPLTSRTDKTLVYIYDIIKNRPELEILNKSTMAFIKDSINKWIANPPAARAYLDYIKEEIESEYRSVNKRFKKATGKELREEKLENLNDRTIY